jgi:hypothetical protein
MLKKKGSSKNVFLSIWLTFTVLILLGSLRPAQSADATYYASDYSVANGTYILGSVPSSLQNVDSDYFTVESAPLSTSGLSYNPTSCTPSGGATYISGTIEDLSSSNDVRLAYRSYPSATSAQALFAHQEATTIAGNTYNTQSLESADLTGTSLSASMAVTGRQVLGRFVYPLSGLGSIPASTWTGIYRAWRDPDQSIAYDSVGSGNNGDGTSNITWTHVVGSGANRFMMIGISIRVPTISALNVTVGGQSATFLRSDALGAEVRGETWHLINPDSGSKIVLVTLSGACKASGGSVSYSGVAQTNPIDNHVGTSYSGVSPSVSLTTTANNDWIFSNLAVSGAATVLAHGAGQVHRYYQIGTGGSGPSRPAADDGDDKPTTTSGLYTVSWNMSFFIDIVAQAVAFKPATRPVGHVDVDVLVRKSDGTIRTTLASGVADSADLTSTPTTLSGTYAMAAYSVVDQTDYLEIDYYVDVTSATSGFLAYLRIDDNALPIADQTKVANVMLPNEYTVEVEFTALSNTFTWTQISWAVETSWSTGSVATTLQLYDFALGGYPTNGDGFISYASNAVADTDETKTQLITANPQDFRDSAGNWRIKVKGVKASSTPFDFRGDWIELRSTYYSVYAASTEFLFVSIANNTMVQLNFTAVSEYNIADVSVTIQVWNYLSSAYVDSGQGYLRYTSSGANETRLLSLDISQQFYMSNGSARIRIASLSSTTIQFQQRINQIKLDCKNAAAATTPSLLSWLTVLLVALPLPFALLLFWFLASRRKTNAKSLVLGKTTAFSKQFGMTHEQMVGKKILLEVDPASDYIIAISGFASEAKKNGESLFIVTNQNSALHSMFPSTENANFLLLTSKTHYPQRINQKETMLPASDVSVLLNACVKAQETHHDKTLNLLFDNISDIILRCGSDKTYQFIRLLLEALSKSNTTALFVFIPTAHDQEVSSSIRGLFQTQLKYTKDGPKA